MNSITKMAIHEAQLKELTNLIVRASEGSILKHEQEYLMDSFNGFIKINMDMMKDLHNGHVENYETLNNSFNILKQSFNMLAKITSDITGKEIPKV
ncbi:hypothetical protein [Bacillus norwichensis]|uniref:Uncharacterized protein n=1 Tax=Bacillus norwichensis TaxID=2762217 RepID=A0ABR8VIG1_9BACI|nr:hypothetical protein [Bacillus norwichensis]MBD8004555.1 hypothetical protein [Bacillus norwichensis]